MRLEQNPTAGLAITLASYWIYVGVMALRVGARTRRLRQMVVPTQRRERFMLLLWVPVVWTWVNLPFAAVLPKPQGFPFLDTPSFVYSNGYFTIIRFAVVGVAMFCLLASIYCWQFMGVNWRMAIDPGNERRLIKDGPFSWVRHPIYALSILLMLCSALILPSILMLVAAAIHICLIVMKARNEEVFLRDHFGPAYDDYCRRTRRFVPRILTPRIGKSDGSCNSGAGTPGGRNKGDTSEFRLNHFQRAMLRWERRHPYNATHAVCLRGPADPQSLKRAIERVCIESGIGELSVDERRHQYAYLPLSSVPFSVLPPSKNSDDVIRCVTDEGANTAFPAGPHHPIRWYVADVPSEGAHVLVLVYHHVAADASAIEAVLARVLRFYFAAEKTEEPMDLAVRPREMAVERVRPFRQYGILRSYSRTVAMTWRVFCSRRPRPEKEGDDRTRTVLRSAPDGLYARLKRKCVQQAIGVNDSFLAALVAAIGEHLVHTPSRLWRHRVVVGSVISRRPKAGPNTRDAFGVCLSDLIVSVDGPNDPFEVIADRIAAHTRVAKKDPQAADAVSDMRLYLAETWWPFSRNSRQSYRRYFPVFGGVSTVHVNQAKFGSAQSHIARYVRACPPGPIMPLILAPTIFGPRLDFTLVHRLSCMDSAAADRLLEAIIAALEDFAGPERPVPAVVAGVPGTVEQLATAT